jgi:hypothetical protein
MAFFFKPPQRQVAKATIIKFGQALLLGASTGVIVFFLISVVINRGAVASGNKGSSTSPSVGSPTASPTPSHQKTMPLRFKNPKAGKSAGPQVNVILTGTVPSSDHLWIFILTGGLYYVQSPPTPAPPDYWTLADVNLGSSSAGDVNQTYTICAVLADAQANSAIKKDLARTKSNTGTHAIPGHDGARKVAQVTVIRTH